MLTGKDNLLQLLKQNELMFWKLRSYPNKHLHCENPNTDKLTLSLSLDFLATQLDLIGPGQYNLEAWETENQKKERKSINFEIPIVATQQQIAGIQTSKEDNQQQINNAVDTALMKYKQEVELQELRRNLAESQAKVKELESEINSSTTRIMNRVEPYLGSILEVGLGMKPNIIKTASALSGADKENIDADQKRLEIAFDKWINVEPEVVTICERIADMAVNDKAMYNMARGMLIK